LATIVKFHISKHSLIHGMVARDDLSSIPLLLTS
jgi:hypothetical protein